MDARNDRGATLARAKTDAATRAGAGDWREREAERKAAKAKEKAERHAAMYAEQAREEAATWQGIKERASALVQAKRGRPPYQWTEELETEIIDRLSNGQSLTSICAMDGMPNPDTVYKRIETSASFAERYRRARENMGAVLFDQCLAIADDDSRDVIETPEGPQVNHAAIQRDKIRIETRFRMAGKFNAALSEKAQAHAGVTVNHNTLQIDARSLDVDQREQLRAMLLEARASMAKPINE